MELSRGRSPSPASPSCTPSTVSPRPWRLCSGSSETTGPLSTRSDSRRRSRCSSCRPRQWARLCLCSSGPSARPSRTMAGRWGFSTAGTPWAPSPARSSASPSSCPRSGCAGPLPRRPCATPCSRWSGWPSPGAGQSTPPPRSAGSPPTSGSGPSCSSSAPSWRAGSCSSWRSSGSASCCSSSSGRASHSR